MDITLLVPSLYLIGWLGISFLSRIILETSPEDAPLVAANNGMILLAATFLLWRVEFNIIYPITIFFTTRTLISAILVWREQNK